MNTIDEKEILQLEKLKIEVRKLTLETQIIPYDVAIKVALAAAALLGAGKWLM